MSKPLKSIKFPGMDETYEVKEILVSPNGTKYILKVDDSGNLSTEKYVEVQKQV